MTGGSDTCFHCLYDEKNSFIVLDTLSGNVQDLSPLKMSKNNAPYFDMNLQVESDDLKRPAGFSEQRYKLFQNVNNKDIEGVVIKRPRFQNDDILITDYTTINTSRIIPGKVEQKLTTISEVLSEPAMYERVNLEAVISIFPILGSINVMERWSQFAQWLFTMKQVSQTQL